MIWLVLRRSRPKPEKLEIKDVTEQPTDPKALAAEQLSALPSPEVDPEQARIEKELVRIAKNDPAMMAGLIRNWMAEDKGGIAR
jgi:flagellar biosynthesis/type III secretory pathway M-ring protein FliF/YscJ